MAKKKYQGPGDRLDLYEAVVATHPDIDRKGATSPYTSRNGWMCSFLDGDGSMGLRLSADDRAEFIERYDSRIVERYGRQMPDFVVVPDDLLERTDELSAWLERGHDWVGTLKPKPTKR